VIVREREIYYDREVAIDISKCEVGIDEIKLRNKVRHYLRGKMP